MKMKQFFTVGLCSFLLLWGLVFADCETLSFDNGDRFCFDIERKDDRRFEVKALSRNFSDSDALSCELELPNGDVERFSDCRGSFRYTDRGERKVQLSARKGERRTMLVTNYDFKKGRFSTDYDNSSYGKNDSYEHRIELSGPKSSSLRKDEWIDVDLLIKDRRGDRDSDYRGRVYFSVEEYRRGSWSSASSYDYELDETEYYFTSSDRGEKRLRNFVKLKSEGEFRLVARLSSSSSSQYGYLSFRIGEKNTDSSTYDNRIELSTPTSHSLRKDAWMDVDVLIKDRRGDRDSDYRGRVYFSVEEYRRGEWSSASSYDYELDETEYYFSSSDRGEKRLRNFIKLKKEGEFRLLARFSSHSHEYAYLSFVIGDSVSSYRDLYDLKLVRISSSSPRENEWIDLTLRALDRRGNDLRDYDGRVRFSLEKKERNNWRVASSYDYELERSSYRFSSLDRGEKVFSRFLKFKKEGEYRLTINSESDRSVSTSQTFSVGRGYSYTPGSDYGYWNSSYNHNFRPAELEKVKAIAGLWKNAISLIKKDYPRLRNNTSWERVSNEFYENMRQVIRDERNPRFKNYDDFYQGFTDWLSHTIRNK